MAALTKETQVTDARQNERAADGDIQHGEEGFGQRRVPKGGAHCDHYCHEEITPPRQDREDARSDLKTGDAAEVFVDDAQKTEVVNDEGTANSGGSEERSVIPAVRGEPTRGQRDQHRADADPDRPGNKNEETSRNRRLMSTSNHETNVTPGLDYLKCHQIG